MINPRSRAGLTLVELLITLAIIGIIGLIAVPGMLRYLPNHRVNNAVKILASEVNLARMRAISTNSVHHLVLDPGTNVIRVYLDDDNDWATANTLVKTVAFADQFPNVLMGYNTVTGVDGSAISQAAKFGTTSSPVRATFLPNGLLVDPGVFYLIPSNDQGTATNDRMRAIQVGRAGQVLLWRYDGTQTPPWKEFG